MFVAASASAPLWSWSLLDPVLLGGLLLVLSRPVPAALGRAQWPSHAPRLALVVWSTVALAAAVSALGVLASLGVAPLGESVLPAVVHLVAGIGPDRMMLPWWSWPVLAAAAAAPAWVAWSAARRRIRLRRARRALRLLVDLAADWDEQVGVHVLEDDRILAYHLPGASSWDGGKGPRIVVTRGCLEGVPQPALAAVLEHERAHAAGRHSTVVGVFDVWREVAPRSDGARQAYDEVRLLTEMLADDRAARQTDRSQALAALVASACGGPVPVQRSALGADTADRAEEGGGHAHASVPARPPRPSPVIRRARRLAGARHGVPVWVRGAWGVFAVVVVAAPVALLAVG